MITTKEAFILLYSQTKTVYECMKSLSSPKEEKVILIVFNKLVEHILKSAAGGDLKWENKTRKIIEEYNSFYPNKDKQ